MSTDASNTVPSALETTPAGTPAVPQVSIGMPVYNGEPFIREALDSLLAQTFTDFELIISDNASTDGTEAICREYAARDARIRYVRQPENLGAAANFQFVLDEAVGEYFMWIAADDCFSAEDYLEKLLNKIMPSIDYVFPDVAIIDSAGKILRSKVMYPFENAKTRFDFAKGSLKINSHQIYGLFKTSQLKEDFYFLEKCKDMPCFGEGLFVHAISTARNGIFVPEACKLYRRHGANASSTLPAKILLPAFLKYSRVSLRYIILSGLLSATEKLRLIPSKLYSDARYALYLLLAIIAQKSPTIKVWGRKLLFGFRARKSSSL